MGVLLETKITSLKLHKRGKVRDIYCIDDERLLIVATDRISAFDVVLNEGIPEKGIVLTKITGFWCNFFKPFIETHFISGSIDELSNILSPEECGLIKDRFVLAKRANVLPFEFIVRGYITGSLWRNREDLSKLYDVDLDKNVKFGDRLKEPLFTPTTKAESGHDEPVSYAELKNRIGSELAGYLRDKSIELYVKANDYCLTKGLIIADTKFEWGFETASNKVILVDEIFTPDSSRYWLKKDYDNNERNEFYDKQIVRNYLESIKWNKTPPAPPLPIEVIEETSSRYKTILNLLCC